jgi:hypothetical protein
MSAPPPTLFLSWAISAWAIDCPTDNDIYTCPGPAGQTCSELLYQSLQPQLLTVVEAPSSTFCQARPGDDACDLSYVWTPNEALLPDDDVLKNSLFVFLPGSSGKAAGSEYVQNMAAFAGYRTIGLTYYNWKEIGDWCQGIVTCGGSSRCVAPSCSGATDNACYPTQYWNECGYKMQMERMTGVDYCTPDPIVMDRKDGVAYRLLLALNTAKAADLADGDQDGDGSANDWHFEQYCVNSSCPVGNPPPSGDEYMDRIQWDKVVLGGYSQGAGMPQPWSLLRQLRGIVSIDGGNFRCGGGTGMASYYSAIPPLFGNSAGGASAGPSEVGIYHADRPWAGGTTGGVPPAWPYLELSASYMNMDNDAPPYDWTNTHDVQRTSQHNVGAQSSGGSGPHHGSMAADGKMPREEHWNDGDPGGGISSVSNVWKLYVFESYVAGFCNAGD